MNPRTDYELTKTDTKMMQGLAVLAMIVLHLFDIYDYENKYIPLLFLSGYPLVFYFGQLSDFCVMAFAFCSGYGHMTQYEKPQYYKRRLIRLLDVYVNFWIILILFSIISFLIGNGAIMPGSFAAFIGNFTTLHLSYNGAWWYILTYALIVITSPVLLRLIKNTGKWKRIVGMFLFAGLYVTAYYVRFNVYSSNWFLHQFGLYGMTAAEYAMGAFAYEYRVFSRTAAWWNNIFKTRLSDQIGSIILFIILLLSRTLVIPQLFFAPLSGYCLLFLFQKADKPEWFRKCFLILGEHSTNIWLTHMFFYLYVFRNLVFIAVYPVLILLFMLGITIPVSVLINAVYKPLQKYMDSRLFTMLNTETAHKT